MLVGSIWNYHVFLVRIESRLEQRPNLAWDHLSYSYKRPDLNGHMHWVKRIQEWCISRIQALLISVTIHPTANVNSFKAILIEQFPGAGTAVNIVP